jgi:hypothetical protein
LPVHAEKKKNATLIFKKLFPKSHEQSRELNGAIYLSSIGAGVCDITAPLLAYPLLRESAVSILEDDNGMKVDWDGDIMHLISASESTLKPIH